MGYNYECIHTAFSYILMVQSLMLTVTDDLMEILLTTREYTGNQDNSLHSIS